MGVFSFHPVLKYPTFIAYLGKMDKLNEYLQALVDTRSEELHLIPNKNPYLVSSNGSADLEARPILGTQIGNLVFPVIPNHLKSILPNEPTVEFELPNVFGTFVFTVKKSPAGFNVKIVPIKGKTTTDGNAFSEVPQVPAVENDEYMPANTVDSYDPSNGYSPETYQAYSEVTAEPSAEEYSIPAEYNAEMYAQPVSIKPELNMDTLFVEMESAGASDLHLSVGMPPMIRKDGKIQPLPFDSDVISADAMKSLLTPIMPKRNREEFDERHDTDFSYEIPELARFRCNVFMDRKGMGGVFRVIPAKMTTASQLGLSKAVLDLCDLSKGLVVVTGPTGSGKSTTLCAMVNHINNQREDHIITIEDPIEFVHENIKCLVNQREVHNHTDSFKDALRAALREDPDILLVGEMRDLETISIAIETAETGHLVFGTLHTTTAASTVDRIIDQFPADRQQQIRVMLSESLRGVVAQTLLPKIGGGRVAALEILIVTPAISNLIREGKTFQIPSAMQTGKSHGMVMLNDALFDLVKNGIVEPKDAYIKAVDKANFETQLTRGGFKI